MTDQTWYQEAIIYEVHVRSFYDSDGDGIGDLRGLAERLDYIEELGVTALWLLPFYPSPLKDDGYDIAAYTEVHPDYGTLGDFQYLLRQAHRRGLKVITELVINHTSDQHPWFQRARRAPPGSVERDFYIWNDTPDRYQQARVLFPELKESNWTYDPVAQQYYWHRFYSHQPDLNFDNPQVRRKIFEIVDFWLEMGIDGLRLDAITYLYVRQGTTCESLPETHAFLRDLRAHIDERYDDRMLLAEANQWPEQAIDYFGAGDECHMTFHFPLMPRLFMAVEMEDRHPIVDIMEQTPQPPAGCQWALFLRNHDELTLEMVTDEERDFMYRSFAPELRMRINLGIRRRLAPLLGGNRQKTQLLYALLFSLPGTPILYYGDEIGMGDNYHLGDRDGVRTPMQWSADRNAGFSTANAQSLFLPVIIDPRYHYVSTNVETQENNPSSLLAWLKRLISIRRESPTFGVGTLELIACTNHRVLAFVREYDGETILVVLNLSNAAQHLHLELSEHADTWPVELWGRTRFPPVRGPRIHRYPLSLGPYDFYWFHLADEPLRTPAAPHRAPTPERLEAPLEVHREWTEIFEGRHRDQFEYHLSAFLSRQHWFNPRSKPIDSLEVGERTRLRWENGMTVICLVEVRYLDGDNDVYLLPLECSPGQRSGEGLPRSLRATISPIEGEQYDEPNTLYDATANPAFATAVLGFIRKGYKIDGLEGSIRGHWLDTYDGLDPDDIEHLAAQVTEMVHSHTSLVFGRSLILKSFRRLERGLSIDVEMGTFLLDHDFDGAAPLLGHLDYHRGRFEPTTLATVHQYVEHRSDGWTWFCDFAGDYLRQAVQQNSSDHSATTTVDRHVPTMNTLHLLDSEPTDWVDTAGGHAFFDELRHLGRRTASLHRVLAQGEPNTAFAPEPFSTAYERARYQSMRTLTATTFRLLRRHLSEVDDSKSKQLIRWVLEHDKDIIARFQALINRGVGGLRLRIHGDYHLGEILRTEDDFIIVDFEGHPWLPPGERRIKRSPLRDVASMCRSFHHACLQIMYRQLNSYHIDDQDPRRQQLFYRCQRLYAGASAALLDGYLQDRQSMDFLPVGRDALAVLLDALGLKKSIQQLNRVLDRSQDPKIALMGIATLLIEP